MFELKTDMLRQRLSKPKLVIFEGPDKVGKSTLFQAYRRATKYGPLCIDRFTGSNYVYDRYYGRDRRLEEYLRLEEKLLDIFDCYLVLLVAPDDVLESRIRAEESGKDLDIALSNFSGITSLYWDYYTKRTNFRNRASIDTTNSIEYCLDTILFFTREGKYE